MKMNNKYPEYKGLNLPKIAEEIQELWEENSIFEASISTRDDQKPFVFFEGPPSANGMPGIHHVMGRSINDDRGCMIQADEVQIMEVDPEGIAKAAIDRWGVVL